MVTFLTLKLFLVSFELLDTRIAAEENYHIIYEGHFDDTISFKNIATKHDRGTMKRMKIIKKFYELKCAVEYLVIDDYRFKCFLNYCFNFTWQIRPLGKKPSKSFLTRCFLKLDQIVVIDMVIF